MAKKKTGSKAKTKKAAKAPKEELVVFAFRLTPTERDAIHKTEDEKGFRAAIKEAREARS